jgi:hypothetical protein
MINLTPGGGYIVRDLYWFFKAYSYFTAPGWYRVDASTSLGPEGDLRMTAFKNPDSNQLTVVILNISTNGIDLMLTLDGFLSSSSAIYRSSATENWVYLGPYGPALTLPAQSITTIHLTGTALPDCNAVRAAGYGLTADITGDCYVNFEDLKIIADNWLRTDCTPPDNCGGADFAPTDGKVDFSDFASFAEQWLWCNDPQNPNCTPNW